MHPKLKNTVIVLCSAFVISLLPATKAFAVWCAADASIILQKILGGFVPFLTGTVSSTGLSAEQSIIAAGAGVRAEVLKTASANKAVDEGLEAYRQERDLQETGLKIQDKLVQAPTTCQSVATSANLDSAAQNAQASAFESQRKLLGGVSNNSGTSQRLDQAHKDSNASFCTPEDAARGVCRLNAAPEYQALAGADRDAAFLFQGSDGSSSHDGLDRAGAPSAQSGAVDAYISRVVAGLPPEQLATTGSDYYKRSPQSRAFVELNRRYLAMISMSSYSLEQIKEFHKPQQGLGTATKMDVAPGFPGTKPDMSASEVIERFVATKFSPASVAGLASAIEPEPILRDMAQISSFNLWMSYQSMLQSSRTEGLAAHQLSLLGDQVLRPQLDAQRGSAVRAATRSR